jgi:hypothetical protein
MYLAPIWLHQAVFQVLIEKLFGLFTSDSFIYSSSCIQLKSWSILSYRNEFEKPNDGKYAKAYTVTVNDVDVYV